MSSLNMSFLRLGAYHFFRGIIAPPEMAMRLWSFLSCTLPPYASGPPWPPHDIALDILNDDMSFNHAR